MTVPFFLFILSAPLPPPVLFSVLVPLDSVLPLPLPSLPISHEFHRPGQHLPNLPSAQTPLLTPRAFHPVLTRPALPRLRAQQVHMAPPFGSLSSPACSHGKGTGHSPGSCLALPLLLRFRSSASALPNQPPPLRFLAFCSCCFVF